MSRPKRPDHAIEVSFRAGFHQCDPLGVVWHGRYYEWMEAARTELFRSRNLAVPEIRALGHRMYVTEAKCRYMAPLHYDETAIVTAWFSGAQRPLIRVAYDIYNQTSGRWSGRALTTLATTDFEGNLLANTPDAILERLPVR